MMAPSCAILSGDPTCGEPRYFCIISGAAVVSSDIRDILCARHAVGLRNDVDHAAISHLLHDGFVPQPRTVYKDVFAVGAGISAWPENDNIRFQSDFPFAKAKSHQDRVADPDTLLRLLAEATNRSCEKRRKQVLMLSAGLDSTSLALAAKAAGRNETLCVTYAEADDDEEAGFARDVCRRLGLRHETYLLDMRSRVIGPILQHHASRSPEPCADPALTACVATLSHFSDEDTVVLDGSGSDIYFWKPPRPLDMAKLRASTKSAPLLAGLRKFVPMHWPHERLLSSPFELVQFPGPRLRHCDTRAFYPESMNTHRYWLRELAHSSPPVDEIRSRVRSGLMLPTAYMLKTRSAAQSTGATVQFPWTDWGVADYCFNLPEPARFSRRVGQTKMIVRDMLRKYLNYDEDLIGKRVFSFGKRKFLAQKLDFCREEILNCSLWSRNIEAYFARLEHRFLRGKKTENALLALLMVSLWHNHWVKGEMPTMLRQQAGGMAA
jgi:asparagine synthetase B (glutamine-hydrolysing)